MARTLTITCDLCGDIVLREGRRGREYSGARSSQGDRIIEDGCDSCLTRLDRAVSAAFRSVEQARGRSTRVAPASPPAPCTSEGEEGA